MRRGLILLAVAAMVIIGIVVGTGDGDAIQGTPEASPAASPAASPEASPVGSPMAMMGDPVEGKNLSQQCIACHSVDGSQMVGPTWLGLYGSEVELDDGTVVIADDAYLAESISDPMKQIVAGYPPAMPPYAGILSDQQIADIVAYIRTLSE